MGGNQAALIIYAEYINNIYKQLMYVAYINNIYMIHV